MINFYKKYKKIICFILLLLTVFSSFSICVFASNNSIIDNTKKASLTIVKYENAYGKNKDNTQNVPLKGVTFTIYKLDNNNFEKTAEVLYQEIKNNIVTLEERNLITNEEGIVRFEDLELGRYLVAETDAPINVTSVIAPFLIDLPRTSDDGTVWNYDVTIYPKNQTVYGNVTLTKYDFDTKAPLRGATWELQKKEKSNWVKYADSLTTNEQGKIEIKNLPVGEYRLVEKDTLEGYILDSSNIQKFTVTAQNTDFDFKVTNDKLEIEKQVKLSDGTYGKNMGVFETEKVNWKITAEVPSIINKMDTYYIEDILPEGLEYVKNSIYVEGLNINREKKLLPKEAYNIEQNGKKLKIDFKTSELLGVNSIELVYDTVFNQNVEYGKAQENKASLTYTNKISIDGNSTDTYTTQEDKAEVHTGKVLIKKVNEIKEPLQGASFKISTTKENAENGIYVKGKVGQDLISKSDIQGNVIFEGLKYGQDGENAQNGQSTYYITEVQTPIYEENGKIKHYNLLQEPVEVIVDKDTGIYSEKTQKIVNKKGFTLPLAGGKTIIFLMVFGIGLITLAIVLRRKSKLGQE